MTSTNPAWVSDADSPVTGDASYALLGILPAPHSVYVFVEGPGEPHHWPPPPLVWVPRNLRLTTPAGASLAFRDGGHSANDRNSLSYGSFDQPPAGTTHLSVQLEVGDEVAFTATAVALPAVMAPATRRIWLADEESRHPDSAYRVLGGVEGQEWLYFWAEGPGWRPAPGGPTEPNLDFQLTVLQGAEALPDCASGSGVGRRRSLVHCQLDRPPADVVRLDVVLTINDTHELTTTVMATDV